VTSELRLHELCLHGNERERPCNMRKLYRCVEPRTAWYRGREPSDSRWFVRFSTYFFWSTYLPILCRVDQRLLQGLSNTPSLYNTPWEFVVLGQCISYIIWVWFCYHLLGEEWHSIIITSCYLYTVAGVFGDRRFYRWSTMIKSFAQMRKSSAVVTRMELIG